jgi:hypothetical protein
MTDEIAQTIKHMARQKGRLDQDNQRLRVSMNKSVNVCLLHYILTYKFLVEYYLGKI